MNKEFKIMNMKNSIIAIALVFFSQFTYGQITDVSYSIEYNSKTCMFDCYLNVNKGETQSIIDRVQFNSQFTIVTPENTELTISERHMPLQDNRDYKGVTPMFWDVTSFASSPRNAERAYYSITPTMVPTSFYNDLSQGDKVKLFSVTVSPMVNCLEDIKLFENGELVSEDRAGLQSDFSNAFTIGGAGQKYNGRNAPSVYPAKPVINQLDVNTHDLTVVANASHKELSNCQSTIDYKWLTPKGKVLGNDKAFPTMNYNNVEDGMYKLVVTDNLGCSTERAFSLVDENNTSETVNGIEDNDIALFASSIFPNPSTSLINLEVVAAPGSRIQSSIYDLNGKVMMSNVLDEMQLESTKEYQIETSLTSGVYTLDVIVNDKQLASHKLIIID